MNGLSSIIRSDTPVLIDFYAEWCRPCQAMIPVLNDVSKRMGKRAKVIKLNVDRHPRIAAEYRVQNLPTLMVFKHGKMIWRQSGVVPAQRLIQVIERSI